MAKDGGQPGDRGSKDARKAEKELRKHLKRLEGELAAASKAEARRLRKFEKARWRRQRIQAFVDEVKAITEADVGSTEPTTVRAVAAPRSAPAPAHATEPAAARATKPRAASPGKSARPQPSGGRSPAPPAPRK
jgi:hypothetical protein